MAPNSISVWSLPQDPLGECSPDTLSGYKGPIVKNKGDRNEERGGLRKGKGKGEILYSSKNSLE